MKKTWPITTIITLVLVGLLNTVLLRPEDIGTWRNYVGYAFLIAAVVSLIVLIWQIKKGKQ